MMPIYREIRLFDDTEISLGFIWQKLYERLHKALVPLKDADESVPVGFTFPGYGGHFPLGDRLRIFAPDLATFENLDLENALVNLTDYLHLSELRATPDKHGYVIFRRKQFKTNPFRQARRYAKRHGLSFEEALKRYEAFDVKEILDKNGLPFFNYYSTSTGQKTKIFIEKSESKSHKEGSFNTFGLSKEGATLPNF